MLRPDPGRRLLGLLLAAIFLGGGLALPHRADASHDGNGPHVSHQHHHGHGVVLLQGDFEAPSPVSIGAVGVPAPRVRSAPRPRLSQVRLRTDTSRPTSRAPPFGLRPRAPPTAIS